MITLKEAFVTEASLTPVEELKRYAERNVSSGPEIVNFVKSYAKLYNLLTNIKSDDFSQVEKYFRADEELPTFFKFILSKFKRQLTDGSLVWQDVPNPNEMKDFSLAVLKKHLKKTKQAAQPTKNVDSNKFAQDMHSGKYGKLD